MVKIGFTAVVLIRSVGVSNGENLNGPWMLASDTIQISGSKFCISRLKIPLNIFMGDGR